MNTRYNKRILRSDAATRPALRRIVSLSSIAKKNPKKRSIKKTEKKDGVAAKRGRPVSTVSQRQASMKMSLLNRMAKLETTVETLKTANEVLLQQVKEQKTVISKLLEARGTEATATTSSPNPNLKEPSYIAEIERLPDNKTDSQTDLDESKKETYKKNETLETDHNEPSTSQQKQESHEATANKVEEENNVVKKDDEEEKVPGEIENLPRYFLLENVSQTECFMNSIVNILWACEKFRRHFLRETNLRGKPVSFHLREIFEQHSTIQIQGGRKVLTAQLLRRSLNERFHKSFQDVNSVFIDLVKKLKTEENAKTLEITTETIRKCEFGCFEKKTESKCLMSSCIIDGKNCSFKSHVDDRWAPAKKKDCPTCKNKSVTKVEKWIDGDYHFVEIVQAGGTIHDFDPNETHQLFGTTCRLIGVIGNGGRLNYAHFMASIRHRNNWYDVDDSNAPKCSGVIDLSIGSVNMLVFEKCNEDTPNLS